MTRIKLMKRISELLFHRDTLRGKELHRDFLSKRGVAVPLLRGIRGVLRQNILNHKVRKAGTRFTTQPENP